MIRSHNSYYSINCSLEYIFIYLYSLCTIAGFTCCGYFYIPLDSVQKPTKNHTHSQLYTKHNIIIHDNNIINTENQQHEMINSYSFYNNKIKSLSHR